MLCLLGYIDLVLFTAYNIFSAPLRCKPTSTETLLCSHGNHFGRHNLLIEVSLFFDNDAHSTNKRLVEKAAIHVPRVNLFS